MYLTSTRSRSGSGIYYESVARVAVTLVTLWQQFLLQYFYEYIKSRIIHNSGLACTTIFYRRNVVYGFIWLRECTKKTICAFMYWWTTVLIKINHNDLKIVIVTFCRDSLRSSGLDYPPYSRPFMEFVWILSHRGFWRLSDTVNRFSILISKHKHVSDN